MWGSRYFSAFFWQAYYWDAGHGITPYTYNGILNTNKRALIKGRDRT